MIKPAYSKQTTPSLVIGTMKSAPPVPDLHVYQALRGLLPKVSDRTIVR